MHQELGLQERACGTILEWLRAPNREPDFLAKVPAREVASSRYREVADRFLHWSRRSGFECQIVTIANASAVAAFETIWTHRGSSFVGFKQPPAQASADDALLLGCAALLENEWCRGKL